MTFAVAVSAAAATLAGLVFVAVSINLKQILEFPNLPARAAQTLILFTTPLITGLFLVVPGQTRAAVAWELIITGVAIGAGQLWINARSPRSDQEKPLTRVVGRIFPPVASCGCLAVGGAALLAQAAGGLYWLVPSVLAAIIFGLVNAWVLLVEILR
jgi:modulator of FtsH protease